MRLEHGHSPDEIARRLDRQKDSEQLREAVFGGIDGTVTTFAIVAGVQGAGLSAGIVVALGLANVLADGFSMAAGSYSGTKAVADDRRRIRAIEERHITHDRQGELDELEHILANKGLSGQVLADARDMIAQDKEKWITMMLTDEYGLPPRPEQPLRGAIVIFTAFVFAGLFPLLPYLLTLGAPFSWSAGLAALTFFAIGAIKSHWSPDPWWRSGLETLLIGGVAAIIAFGVGRMFHP